MSDDENNVIPMRKPTEGPEGHPPTGVPELIFDPDTKRWGIMVDCVEVISGLDPVGLRERIRAVASEPDQRTAWGIPRRACLDKLTPAERAIYDAAQAVESLPPDVRLTHAVIQLGEARDLVADFVDGVPFGEGYPRPAALPNGPAAPGENGGAQ